MKRKYLVCGLVAVMSAAMTVGLTACGNSGDAQSQVAEVASETPVTQGTEPGKVPEVELPEITPQEEPENEDVWVEDADEDDAENEVEDDAEDEAEDEAEDDAEDEDIVEEFPELEDNTEHNSPIMVETVEMDEKELESIIYLLDLIHAGEIQSATKTVDSESGVIHVDIVAEDGTNYRIDMTSEGKLIFVQNMDTGDLVISSEQ